MRRNLCTITLVLTSVSVLLGSFLPTSAQLPQSNKTISPRIQKAQRETAQPSPDVIGYWQSLQARSDEPLAVSWNKGTGTPKSIAGKIPSPVRGSSEMSARSFLQGNAPLFKLGSDTSNLKLTRALESLIGEHFIFDQYYSGVRVFGAQVGVHFDKNGDIVTVNNTYQPSITLDSIEPKLGKTNAESRALSLTRGASANPSSELVVLNQEGSFALAWRVVVSTTGPTWEIFLNAQNGAMLGFPRDLNQYVIGSGQVFSVNAVVAARDPSLRDNGDAASAVPASAYSIVSLPGLFGNGNLDGEFASSSKTKKRAFSLANSFIFDRSNDGFSETMGYYYIDHAQRYLQSLGFTNVNNRQQVFSVNRLKYDNSFYSPGSLEISLGIGGVDDAEDAEIILHEYGHSIQDNQVPGFGSSEEAGAMGEGFGDYWGASVGAQFSGGFQDLCFADWDATSYSFTDPPCLRRLDGTKHYPEDVVGEVHDDGEIWSAALWQIRGAIGATESDQAIIAAHFLLAPNASFNEGANGLVMASISLGYNHKQLNNIRSILKSRGFTVTL